MNETEHTAAAGSAPRGFWIKKVAMVLGGLLFISISVNVVLWFETLGEMHASISSVKEELEKAGLWAHAFRKSHGRLPSMQEQAEYGMRGKRYKGLDMKILEEKDSVWIGFEMKDKYKGVYDVSGHRVIFDKEMLEKWRRNEGE